MGSHQLLLLENGMSIEVMKQMVRALEDTSASKHISRNSAIQAGLKAIAESTDLDAICQDLQEKTYTQAMRIAELEAKLKEKNT